MPHVVKNIKNLSAPAQLMLVSALVLIVHYTVTNFNLSLFVGTLVSVAVMIYNNNCLVTGKCNTWAWVLVSLYIIISVLEIINPLGLISIITKLSQLKY
tara:strand:+ start:2653 stop:2949 length:297 start_codon:yes stop_codon:yes gene_type:complete